MGTFVFANARPAVPFSYDGGAERTTFEILSGLARKGVSLIQISAYQQGEVAARNAASMGMVPIKDVGDIDYGHFRICSRREHLLVRNGSLSIIGVDPSEFQIVCRDIVTQLKPAVLVTWLKGSDYVVELGNELKVPTVLRIVGPDSLEGFPRVNPDTIILANSPATAQISSEYYNRKVDFLLGVIDHEAHVAADRTPEFVTYINPRQEKGIHLFCKIAGLLPALPFLVVRGWSRTNLQRDELRAMEFLSSLPNVTVSSPLSDMREIYRLTSILLLPSRWPEAWARVIGEAQANGIPVIASNRGSSPQSVGEGGIILDYGDPRLWASTIRMLYEDGDLRSQLGDYAKLNTKRFDSDALIEEYLEALSAFAAGRPRVINQPIGKVKNFCSRRDAQGKVHIEALMIGMNAAFDLSEPAHP